jgi:hypothetical protein
MNGTAEWPEWLFIKVPGDPVGAAMIVVTCILVIWGVALIISADRKLSFPHALGWFMIADATVYGLLALAILRSSRPVDLWVAMYFLMIMSTAVVAFIFWARSHLGD